MKSESRVMETTFQETRVYFGVEGQLNGIRRHYDTSKGMIGLIIKAKAPAGMDDGPLVSFHS